MILVRLKRSSPCSNRVSLPLKRALNLTLVWHRKRYQSQPRNPYKGLQAFRQEDQHDFFGRDALADKLTRTLAGTLQTELPGKQNARLLAIIGPSGSGKSSVMMAGLLPRLQQGGMPGSEASIYLDPIIPGVHPLESLALVLAERLPDRSLLSEFARTWKRTRHEACINWPWL